MQLYLILLIIFAIFIAIFAMQNTMAVVVRLLFWNVNTSLVLLVLVSLAIGAIMMFLVDLANRISMGKERKEMDRQIAALANEKEELQKMVAGKEQSPEGSGAPVTEEPAEPQGPSEPEAPEVLPDEGASPAEDGNDA